MADTKLTELEELKIDSLEEMVLNIKAEKKQVDKVRILLTYMKKRNVNIAKNNLHQSPPNFILNGGSSVGYRNKMQLSPVENKIIIFCNKDEEDKRRLESRMGKKAFKNTEGARPYGIAFEPEEFIEAVNLLLENPNNR